MSNKHVSLWEVFDSALVGDECWEWQKGRDLDGYGRWSQRGKGIRAHRASYCAYYEMSVEELKNTGSYVCHSCDNPSCINPLHLWLGGPSENNKDSVRKGRWPSKRDGGNGNTKLTADEVVRIRADSRTYRVIAKEYGISSGHVSEIKHRHVWSHI